MIVITQTTISVSMLDTRWYCQQHLTCNRLSCKSNKTHLYISDYAIYRKITFLSRQASSVFAQCTDYNVKFIHFPIIVKA